MDAERVKEFAVFYISILMPILLFLLAIIVQANLLWYLLLIGWLGAGLFLVFLPTHPDSPSG